MAGGSLDCLVGNVSASRVTKRPISRYMAVISSSLGGVSEGHPLTNAGDRGIKGTVNGFPCESETMIFTRDHKAYSGLSSRMAIAGHALRCGGT